MTQAPDRPAGGGLSLRGRAIRLLARRDYARAELKARLAAHAESATALDALLDALEAEHLLSDVRYAEQRVNARTGRLGNARIEYELRTKGVDDAIIGAALDAAGSEIERARVVWQKKFGIAPTTREAWARQARFLQSRGFSPETIRSILNDRDESDARNARDDA